MEIREDDPESRAGDEGRNPRRPTLRVDAATALAAEAPRTANPPPAPVKEEEGLSLFWRLFGSTVLSIVALLAVTLYQQLNAKVEEIRTDLKQVDAGQGDLVQKDEFNSRMTIVAAAVKETAADLKERKAAMEQQLKVHEAKAEELARELQRLRERLATVEGRQSAAPPARAPR